MEMLMLCGFRQINLLGSLFVTLESERTPKKIGLNIIIFAANELPTS